MMELNGKELADFEKQKVELKANLLSTLTFFAGMLFMLALILIFR
jgi:hypothetical protein